MLEMEIIAIRETIEKQRFDVADVEIEVAVSDSDEVKDLRALISNKKGMLHRVEAAAAAGKDDPAFRRLEREIAAHERILALAATEARPQIAEQLKSMAALDRQDLLKQLAGRVGIEGRARGTAQRAIQGATFLGG